LSGSWPTGPNAARASDRGRRDHMIIGRNKIGVQHMIKVFAKNWVSH